MARVGVGRTRTEAGGERGEERRGEDVPFIVEYACGDGSTESDEDRLK